jgi:MFS transporter, PPP family, 3-phenylpropionic acid transporter
VSVSDTTRGDVAQAVLPYWRLSSFYFFYFAVVGTMMPFWGLYLQTLDFSAEQIGIVGAIMMGTRVVAPSLWGWLGDRTGKRLAIVRLGSFLACLCFLVLFFTDQFLPIALAVAAYSFFWNAVLAQFEVISLGYLGSQPLRYSRIRLWGSVGFIVAVMGLGVVFDLVSIRYLPFFAITFLVLIWLSNHSIREQVVPHSPPRRGDLMRVLRQPAVIAFLLSSCLLQVSHGAYYTFYSVYLEALDYSRSAIGGLWALGVVAEVLVFMAMPRWFEWISLRRIMVITLVITVVRWWLIGCYADSITILLFAQLLHAFSFGSAHAVAIELVRRFFTGSVHGQGQALYSAASFGVGGALGALISGLVWSHSSVLAFAISAVAAALALLVVWRYLHVSQTD